jgi:hypothetical protein
MPSYLKTSQSGFYVNDLPISLDVIDAARKEQSFNDYVVNVHNAEIIKVVQRFVDRQKKQLNSKELLSNVTMIQRHNNRNSTISQDGRFVGYAITPRESKSINIKIKSIGVRGSGSQSVTFYLFDPNKEAAIQTQSISITPDMTWTTVNWNIEFDKSDGGAGSSYLIGYFEDDLSVGLYEQDWSDGMAHQSMKITRHYAGLSPVRFSSSTLDGTNCPDTYYLKGALNCKTSGFNLRFNVTCDITDVLVDNIDMFGEAVQYAVAIRYMNDAMGNPDLNNIISSAQNREQWVQTIADFEGQLYGGYIENVGYRRGIIDNLSLDFSELDAVCLKARADRISQVKW